MPLSAMPMPAADMKVEEIDYVAVHQPFVYVAERAAENQRQCGAEQFLPAVAPEQPDDDQCGDDAQRGEHPPLPAAGGREETERGAAVVDQQQIEE
ncbi:hypothetical protein DFQ28_001766 [Apophysomyces sp. BC1034]|nr:hypothetical protein DFQ28_001766 [Apophysomyces sp. BC1034]